MSEQHMLVTGLHCPCCGEDTRQQWLGESIFSGSETETLTRCMNFDCVEYRPSRYDDYMHRHGDDPCSGPVFRVHTRRLAAIFAQAQQVRI